MPPTIATTIRRSRAISIPIILAAVLVLAGCGSQSGPDAPTATAPVASPTLAPGEVTVDSLLKRIDTAWAGTTSMVATSWTAPYADSQQGPGTPPTDQMVTVERVIRPSSRSITTSIGGAAVDEQVAVNGITYFRGTSVTTAIAPFVDASTWVKVDPATLADDSPIGQQLTYLTSAPAPPYGTVSDDLRQRGATKSGQVTVGSRTCDTYTFRDTTDESGIAYTLAIDSANLPCFLILAAGGYADITTWSFDDPTTAITAPADAITMPATTTP